MQTNRLLFILCLVLFFEVCAGYLLHVASAYQSKTAPISATLQIFDKLISEPQQNHEGAQTTSPHDPNNNKQGTVLSHKEECDKKKLAMDILVPAYFNSHKVEDKSHLKFKLQFSDPEMGENLIDNGTTSDHFVILLSGGSEVMGYSHGGYKVHETLQEQLRSKFNTQKITVINSANYGHFLTDDVTFFNLVGSRLNPRVLILHSGRNDFWFGLSAIKDSKAAGYSYSDNYGLFTKYSKISATNEKFSNINNKKEDCFFIQNENLTVIKDQAPKKFKLEKNRFAYYEPAGNEFDVILDRYVQTLNNFIDQLEIYDLDYLVGIETFNKIDVSRMRPGMFIGHHQDIRKNLNLLERLKSDSPKFYNFNNLSRELSWEDETHTDTNGAKKIADIYFNLVVKNYGTKIETFLTRSVQQKKRL